MYYDGAVHQGEAKPACKAAIARGCNPRTSERGTPVPASMLIGTRIHGKTGMDFDLAALASSARSMLGAGIYKGGTGRHHKDLGDAGSCWLHYGLKYFTA